MITNQNTRKQKRRKRNFSSLGNMDGKDILDRFQKDVDKFMTEKGAEGWN